jgi:adenine-specific DNA-methyltransferase
MIQRIKASLPIDIRKNNLFKKKRYQKEQVDPVELEAFHKDLQFYLHQILNNKDATEEWIKHSFKAFLSQSLYSDFNASQFNVGTGSNPIDLILWDSKYEDTMGVIIELKSLKNKTEFPTTKNLNVKAMHEALLYFSRERLLGKNIYHICITNGIEIFLFDARQFEDIFQLGKQDITQYLNGQTFFNKTSDFYTDIAKGLIDHKKDQLDYLYIDLSSFSGKEISKKKDKDDLQNLYKILHRRHLLKEYVRTNGTGINKDFYKELLYILGIKEDDKGILMLDHRIKNSIISQIYHVISSKDLVYEDTFAEALKLAMVWMNRLLFLKLLEDQLQQVDPNFKKFLDCSHLKNFSDLNTLFFEIFNKPKDQRNLSVLDDYKDLPYLNSSLFSINDLEQEIGIIRVVENLKIDLYGHSILYEYLDNESTQNLPLLEYLLSFLNAYQFGSLNPQNSEKELIDHNVLGCVFELLNGYKDGSVYTPRHLCEYMVEESISQLILSKINKSFHLSLKSLDEINYNEIAFDTQLDRKSIKAQINEMINELTIVDPAVGTGHFLTSVITYLLHLKSKLGLYDQSLADYQIHLENDDIAIRHRDTQRIYVYTKAMPNHVQKFIFEEKKLIIEKILHGVDINPLSVDLCKLRLWIELLKHSYFDDHHELMVLPNLETKIRQGNSLINRLKWYKTNHANYPYLKQAISEIKLLNHELFNCKDKARAHQIRKMLQEKRDFLLAKVEIKLPVSNAFYWQIDFPNLIDDDGIIGFDLVIGNPPYISLSKLKDLTAILKKDKKSALNIEYETFDGNGDIYALFYELGYELLKDQGILSFITSNKFMRAGYGAALRRFLSNKVQVQSLIDLGSSMFDKATVDTCILSFIKEKAKEKNKAMACDLSKEKVTDLKTHPKSWLEWNPPIDTPEKPFGSEDAWVILDDMGSSIKKKIEAVGTPLKEWKDIKIYRGVVTGLDDVFIVDGKTKKSILDQCVDDEERQRTSELFNKVLRGRDIKRYMNVWDEVWIINLRYSFTKSLDIDFTQDVSIQMMNRFPSLFNHFQKFLEPMKKRSDQGEFWWELRSCIYISEFNKPKILYQEICQRPSFYYDNEGYFLSNSAYFLTVDNHLLKYLLASLNSKLFEFAYKNFYAIGLGGNGVRYTKQYMEILPVIEHVEDDVISNLNDIIDQIQSLKQLNHPTQDLEDQIDQIIYRLYQLDPQEIAYIEAHLKI